MREMKREAKPLTIGWGAADITPDQPVQLVGQHYARISEGVRDPVTATALALAAGAGGTERVIFISCDLVSISDALRDAVRACICEAVPELSADAIVLNATHTHTAPLSRLGLFSMSSFRANSDSRPQPPAAPMARQQGAAATPDAGPELMREIDLPAMEASAYIAWASRRIADAAIAAWRGRAPGSVGYALGQAVVGRNRRSVYGIGESRMYGNTAADDFSHIEGYEDHSVNLLAAWDAAGRLTGVIVNVPCPAQETENLFEISADYWHDTRVELRRRLGADLFVLPQCSTAGDQSPHVQWDKAAVARMLRLKGLSARQEIAVRIANAVEEVLPYAEKERQAEVVFMHQAEVVELSRRRLTERDVQEARDGGEPFRIAYEQLVRELEQHPEKKQEPRWYVPVTRAYRKWRWHANVALRYEQERVQPRLPVEVHLVRLGDVVLATNPFEYYLDFGIRIKARSPAVQTFLVQLAGVGSYVPSPRSVAGKGYGSVPASTVVGPEGGEELADWTVDRIRAMWA